MHDIRFIREHPDAFDRALARRGLPPESKQLIEIEARRRNLITRLEHAQAQRNAESKKIGEAKRKKDETVANRLMTEVAKLRAEISEMEGEVVALERELQFGKRIGIGAGLATLPNMPLDEVPDGKDSNDNVEHHRFGAKRDYAFTPKQHFELGEALGQMDFETAAKLSGARFVVLKRGLARLERALGQFMLDVHTSEHGYTEVAPPLVVRDEAMFGTAQLPKFSDDQFRVETEEVQRKHAYANFEQDREQILAYVEKYGVEAARRETLQALGFVYRPTPDRRWLIPTAEVPLTNFVMDSITDEAQLPMRLTACTPCFRAEAGAAGKDTRGMIRQHQFTKVELVSITTSEQSRDEHERMLSCAEEVLRRLDLHYRVVTL
ncbi:MAG: serine--tRNA ligase, partial [Xanthobacteraceae bacterium]